MPPGRKGTRKQAPFGSTNIRVLEKVRGCVRARGYARVSSLAQADALNPVDLGGAEISLPEQIRAIAKFCERRGYEYTGCHWDIHSGISAERRGLRELCAAARARQIDVVVIWRTNRLFRGASGGAPIYFAWEDAGRSFRVESITDDFDMDRYALLGWANQTAAEDLRTHSIESRLARARRGEAVSSILPYWLRRDPQTRRPVLVAANVEAVLHAIKMYLAGATKRAIAEWLRENAPQHPSRVTAWNPASVHNLLRHRALYGQLQYSRARPTVIPVSPVIHANAQHRADCVDTSCLACRQTFTYEDVERERRQRTKRHRDQPSAFPSPLKHVAYCGVCDTALIQTTQRFVYHRVEDGTYKKYPLKNPISLLRCHSQQVTNTSGRRCRDTGYLRADWLFDRVKSAITTLVNDSSLCAKASPSKTDRQKVEMRWQRLLQAREANTRALAQLWRDKTSGVIEEEVLHLLKISLSEERGAIDNELRQMRLGDENTQHDNSVSCDAVQLIERLRQAPKELETANDEGWSRYAAVLLERVEVMADRSVRYRWRFVISGPTERP